MHKQDQHLFKQIPTVRRGSEYKIPLLTKKLFDMLGKENQFSRMESY